MTLRFRCRRDCMYGAFRFSGAFLLRSEFALSLIVYSRNSHINKCYMCCLDKYLAGRKWERQAKQNLNCIFG